MAPHRVHDVLGQHAGRGVGEDEDALAADLEAGQVLAIPVAHERADVPARHLLARRPAGEALRPLLERLEVGLQLVDVLPLRDRLRVVDRELSLDLLQRLQDPRREALGRRALLLDLAERVPELDQPLVPVEDLLLALVHLRLERLA